MTEHVRKKDVWVIVLCTVTMLVSLSSAGFTAFVYLNTPNQIKSYVNSHKEGLKGEKGDTGEMGPQGIPGQTGATGASGSTGSLYCSTYDYSFGSSTSCF